MGGGGGDTKVKYRQKFIRKFTLEVALGWKPITIRHEELLVFFGTIH